MSWRKFEVGVYAGPDVSESGLVLALDAANSKSYPGSGTTWTDLSGRGNNGTLVNGVGYNGSNLGSLVFDGVNDYVNAGSLGTSIPNFTVEIWFKSGAVANYRNPIDCNFGTYGSNTGPRLEQNSTGNLVWIIGNSSGTYYTRTVVSSGLSSVPMHCAVITRNGTTTTSYYNGTMVQTGIETYTHPGAMTAVNIGRGFTTSGERWFNGQIPLVKIYNRALTAQEIQQNYNATKSRFGL